MDDTTATNKELRTGVFVGVSTAGYGNHGCKFRITKRGTATGQGCGDEGNDRGWPGKISRCNPGQDENPRAADTADSQHSQTERPQDAVHAAVLFRFR